MNPLDDRKTAIGETLKAVAEQYLTREGDKLRSINTLPTEWTGFVSMLESFSDPVTATFGHVMRGNVIDETFFGVLGDAIDGHPKNLGKASRQIGQGELGQRLSIPDCVSLVRRFNTALLDINLVVDISGRRQRDERIDFHATRNVPLHGLGCRANLIGHGSALGRERSIPLRKLHSLIPDDDAVEISLLLDVDDVA